MYPLPKEAERKRMVFEQEAFGKRVRELRQAKGYTQEAFAERLNISHTHENLIENGKNGCSIDLIMDIATLLDADLNYLMGGKRYEREKEEIRQLEKKKRLQQKLEEMLDFIETELQEDAEV